ncbi:MAG: deoxyguanosinetriphosphate triphosphohydrolase [Bacillota bacterium]
MNNTYEIEKKYLSKYAFLSENSVGRYNGNPEPCELRTPFQRDRDRIQHSKSFRRLKNKTQVFIQPSNDHCRTRMTHTLDVSQIARTIARILCLNEDLTEAIALGHDLGHTPFGHAGERALATLSEYKFAHNKQSLRVVDFLEGEGKGLNLTMEVRDGILNHTKRGKASTLEGVVVSFADRIAYINHDIDDSLRAGVLKIEEVPEGLIEIFGATHSKRIHSMVSSIYRESFGKDYVSMEKDALVAFEEMRTFMFQNVYSVGEKFKEEHKVVKIITELFGYYMDKPEKLPQFLQDRIDQDTKEIVVCDYIATMTDNFALDTYKGIFLPKSQI